MNGLRYQGLIVLANAQLRLGMYHLSTFRLAKVTQYLCLQDAFINRKLLLDKALHNLRKV